jgi:hypothetical protein
MLPPGGRNWQLIYPNYSFNRVPRHIFDRHLLDGHFLDGHFLDLLLHGTVFRPVTEWDSI